MFPISFVLRGVSYQFFFGANADEPSLRRVYPYIHAYIHAYYVLRLRHAEGWVGYGVRIHNGRFRNLAETGEGLTVTCQADQIRRLGPKAFGRYTFHYTQGERSIYEGQHSAMWLHTPSMAAEVQESGVSVDGMAQSP